MTSCFNHIRAIVSISLISLSSVASDFKSAVAQFEKYRSQAIAEIQQKNGGYTMPAAPFVLVHPYRTRYSVVLVHGLNDSPYYLKDIAKVLFEEGMNVLTVLLPGHATVTEDMSKTSFTDWIREVGYGVEMAQGLGNHVLLGGFSTGGLLAVFEALRSQIVKGLFLFAPALNIGWGKFVGNRVGSISCLKPIEKFYFDTDIEENPIKYARRSFNSICQVSLLINELYKLVGETLFFSKAKNALKKIAARIRVPTYVAVTTEDARLNTQSLIDLSATIPTFKSVLVYTPDGRDIIPFEGLQVADGISLPHSYIALKTNEYNPQFNPYFNLLESSLRDFVRKAF